MLGAIEFECNGLVNWHRDGLCRGVTFVTYVNGYRFSLHVSLAEFLFMRAGVVSEGLVNRVHFTNLCHLNGAGLDCRIFLGRRIIVPNLFSEAIGDRHGCAISRENVRYSFGEVPSGETSAKSEAHHRSKAVCGCDSSKIEAR